MTNEVGQKPSTTTSLVFVPDIAVSVTNAAHVATLLAEVFGGQILNESDTETRVPLNGLVLNLDHVDTTMHTVWVTVSVPSSEMDLLVDSLRARGCTSQEVSIPQGGVLCDTGHGVGFLLDPTL